MDFFSTAYSYVFPNQPNSRVQADVDKVRALRRVGGAESFANLIQDFARTEIHSSEKVDSFFEGFVEGSECDDDEVLTTLESTKELPVLEAVVVKGSDEEFVIEVLKVCMEEQILSHGTLSQKLIVSFPLLKRRERDRILTEIDKKQEFGSRKRAVQSLVGYLLQGSPFPYARASPSPEGSGRRLVRAGTVEKLEQDLLQEQPFCTYQEMNLSEFSTYSHSVLGDCSNRSVQGIAHFVNQRSLALLKYLRNPNVLIPLEKTDLGKKITSDSRDLCDFVALTILAVSTLDEAVKRIQFWISVMMLLEKFKPSASSRRGNYHAWFAVYGGITRGPISRLKDVWKRVGSSQRKYIEAAKSNCTSKQRTLFWQRVLDKGLIPYFGIINSYYVTTESYENIRLRVESIADLVVEPLRGFTGDLRAIEVKKVEGTLELPLMLKEISDPEDREELFWMLSYVLVAQAS